MRKIIYSSQLYDGITISELARILEKDRATIMRHYHKLFKNDITQERKIIRLAKNESIEIVCSFSNYQIVREAANKQGEMKIHQIDAKMHQTDAGMLQIKQYALSPEIQEKRINLVMKAINTICELTKWTCGHNELTDAEKIIA
jgi:DNA-binding transcriptional ArsR family regulator